ncbi:protein-L-isoaspartate(D-aspartate) O-methyltransferase [Salinihabitans flavidus]|uniref:Protein-L-isoaspartate O-methyltransferase n=1 Tax=Salinihabitans flavidus TaxID=569882 RepID=A0A1H8W7G8_9RHOB|nr:protein-L-isoaspartate(D-aspartate) O-methyltransferase [Salinihabitans flavidus]SEP23560.1 protein-L-isoaspartate(D-aspartate) O-methyltransferase [Salinihabitans flavidus]
MTGYDDLRKEMVERQVKARGVRDPLVLDAMRRVPRERFVPDHLKGQAYRDCPLPIDAGQTISQPYIVAYMAEALALKGGEKVLEIGAGSGYAAAVLAEIAGEVFAIERHGTLATRAAAALQDAAYTNVHILHGDGTRGWEDAAPFDAILVSAGAPFVPETLKSQLAMGGRMVVPVGNDPRAQELVRVTRRDKGQFDREDLADVRFVPLIGDQGWEGEPEGAQTAPPRLVQHRPRQDEGVPGLIRAHAEAFEDVESAPLDLMMDRIGDARVVLIGEASHGTSEFYRIRALITKRLIEEKGFTIVAAEADWPDAARIDHYVRHRETPPSEWQAFARFPMWMWRNEEVRAFTDWLREWNAPRTPLTRVGFYGLDLYSLFNSTLAIIDYLEDVDPDLARIARHRYGCLSPWEADPAAYGHAALTGAYRNCEDDVTAMLVDLMRKRKEYALSDGERFLDAAQNAALVANAEKYYRIMYYGSRASWNLRDDHMFETLQNVMNFHGDGARAVVWAHNSHIGDARATEMSRRGERNLGELCARGFGDKSYRIGMGTDHGTVAAASDWNGEMEIKQVRPSHPQSYERQFHLSGLPGLILPLRAELELDVATELSKPRLERAIGVIYRPETELASHYFEAELPRQFNEYVWIDETTAVSPLGAGQTPGLPETYPFGT